MTNINSTKEPTNTDTKVRTTWKEQKNKLKAQFQNLNDNDLYYEDGKKTEMLAKVQKKIGKTKEELDALLASY